MRVGRKLGIDMTMQSFKRYLKVLLFQAKCDMDKIKRCPWMEGNDYDRYADAVYMLKLNEDFELLLRIQGHRVFPLPFPGGEQAGRIRLLVRLGLQEVVLGVLPEQGQAIRRRGREDPWQRDEADEGEGGQEQDGAGEGIRDRQDDDMYILIDLRLNLLEESLKF